MKQKAAAKATGSKDSLSGSHHHHLEHALDIADVAYTLTSPLLQSIRSLLNLASQVINSDEASVITRDEKRAGLKFLVATGSFANELKKIRIPPGKGIAGFVFTTGQPLAVSDVSREESFYAEVDQVTGHSTRTILATPLRVREETIGVLEFVNRTGEPPYEPFSPMEMDQAAQFADTIALLVDAHEQANLVESFLTHALRGDVKTKKQNLNKWIVNLRAAPEHKELLLLAAMLRDVAAQGEEERRLCLDVLTAISRWTLKRSSPQSDFSSFELE
ncbi:MAG: GAF domain-containing protein [Pyrinomonadaceae bacterium]